MDLSDYCQLQINFSNYFSTWTQRSFLPLLVIFHGSAFIFLFRARKEEAILPGLPLEFGILNLLFPVSGTMVFIFGLIVEIISAFVINGLPGSDNILFSACKTTRGFYPGLIATILSTAGLFYSQATGWLGRVITRLSPQKLKNCLTALLILSGSGFLLTLPVLISFL
ncbi:MAG: hypothetical protein LLG42_04515 [Chloroflexi bacterium]|nr:hypothetical protein [Chloroflexota bacterium]